LTAAQFALAQGERSIEISQEHKDKVTDVVQELKELAGKDFNISEEVREVAKELEEFGERAAQALEKIEKRGGFKTFLFGTDYKNIGAIKSELVTAENHINRLMKAAERTVDEIVKTDLSTLVSELKKVSVNAENFIKENEDKFSIFGWFVKLFN
jgi:ABC-type transporter Mla subunit MlaD